MRPVTVRQAAAGRTEWTQVDYVNAAFGIGLAVSFSSDANLTAQVEYTFDGLGSGDFNSVQVVQSASALATVTDLGPDGNGHRLNTNDSVYVLGAPPSTVASGLVTVTVVDPTHYTYNAGVSQTINQPAQAQGMRVFVHPTLVGLTARQEGYLAFPVVAVRLHITAYTAGACYLDIVQGDGL